MNPSSARMPVVYLRHGARPWPFMDFTPLLVREEAAGLADYLAAIPKQLPRPRKALVVISAHWEEPTPTMMTSRRPPMRYDYYGFSQDMHQLLWPAPAAVALDDR